MSNFISKVFDLRIGELCYLRNASGAVELAASPAVSPNGHVVKVPLANVAPLAQPPVDPVHRHRVKLEVGPVAGDAHDDSLLQCYYCYP